MTMDGSFATESIDKLLRGLSVDSDIMRSAIIKNFNYIGKNRITSSCEERQFKLLSDSLSSKSGIERAEAQFFDSSSNSKSG